MSFPRGLVKSRTMSVKNSTTVLNVQKQKNYETRWFIRHLTMGNNAGQRLTTRNITHAPTVVVLCCIPQKRLQLKGIDDRQICLTCFRDPFEDFYTFIIRSTCCAYACCTRRNNKIIEKPNRTRESALLLSKDQNRPNHRTPKLSIHSLHNHSHPF